MAHFISTRMFDEKCLLNFAISLCFLQQIFSRINPIFKSLVRTNTLSFDNRILVYLINKSSGSLAAVRHYRFELSLLQFFH